MSVEDHTVSFSLQINVEDTLPQLRRVLTVLSRTMGLLRRFGGSEELDAVFLKIQRLIILINTLRLAVIAIHTAAGPLGWALAAIGAVTFAMDAGDFAMDLGG